MRSNHIYYMLYARPSMFDGCNRYNETSVNDITYTGDEVTTWNKRRMSGANEFGYQNRDENAGLLNSLTNENYSRRAVASIFINGALSLSQRMSITGVVRGNSDVKASNYLYTLNNSLLVGEQYTSSDTSAKKRKKLEK